MHAEGDGSGLLDARDALEAVGQLDRAAEAAALAAHAAWRAGRGADADEILTRAVASLEGSLPAPGFAAVLAEKGRLDAFAGRLDEAERTSTHALELATRLELEELKANVLSTRGVIRMIEGDFRQSRVHLEEAANLAASSSERVRALTNLAVLWDSDGYRAKRTATAASQTTPPAEWATR